MTVPYISRASVMTTGGIVSSTSPLAASAGLRVLAEGGNAFDAAIATESRGYQANGTLLLRLSVVKLGSAGRTRTYDPPVNSRLLYH